ncbi:trypsin-like serine protease [Staphylococcus delphini]|uniref:trypsin-like serine peptidase n=1 Tax=Staphylococcus delphini TaxID=53344 RepID=UPI0021CFA4CF|nr:trypsin-like serine protease [Staphylococcus delphini]UXS29030.1 trypsin-like serine protease [Staphylococcus delphini]
MKRLQLLLLLSLACFIILPIDNSYAQEASPDTATEPHQEVVPDTVKDTHSKYTAKYVSGISHTCTAILISSTAAVTAKHCGGTKYLKGAGTIYPGASGPNTPFGYMNIREYFPHPKYDIAVIRGLLRDQSKAYQYYIRPFSTKVTGYTDEDFNKFVNSDVYSYGYPYKGGVFMQYRSDGKITHYSQYLPQLVTNMPAYKGQSGAGLFTKDSKFLGIIVSSTNKDEANVLPFNKEIADWINAHAN